MLPSKLRTRRRPFVGKFHRRLKMKKKNILFKDCNTLYEKVQISFLQVSDFFIVYIILLPLQILKKNESGDGMGCNIIHQNGPPPYQKNKESYQLRSLVFFHRRSGSSR